MTLDETVLALRDMTRRRRDLADLIADRYPTPTGPAAEVETSARALESALAMLEEMQRQCAEPEVEA